MEFLETTQRLIAVGYAAWQQNPFSQDAAPISRILNGVPESEHGFIAVNSVQLRNALAKLGHVTLKNLPTQNEIRL